MLVARLVGPTGEVVAIERDPKSIAKAQARVTDAGFHNVSFSESAVGEILDDKPFDAAVGRFILMYLPDPAATLRSISQVVRPGGLFVFQEPDWVPVLAHLARGLSRGSATARARSGHRFDFGAGVAGCREQEACADRRRRLELRLGLREQQLADRFVGEVHGQAVGVRLAVDDDGLDPELATRADDAQRDLASVRDEDLIEGQEAPPSMWSRRRHSRSAPPRGSAW